MAVSQQKLISLNVVKLKNLVNLNIDFNDSPVTAILGPNGNGKSTVLHILACAFQPISKGENHKFSNFFLPNTDALWNGSEFMIYHSFRDGQIVHVNIPTEYGKSARWTPIYARRPKREVFYIGIDKCVPMIELEKKQGKINYETNAVDEEIFAIILQKASEILNKRYIRFNIHTASGKDFIGVEIEGLRYSALSMSAGEQKVFHILNIVFNAPKYSLILIDELDLLLHDKAMASLVKVIHERATSQNLQIIFTTHRESIISLTKIVNIRHLFTTSLKTLCFNETKPDAINRLTGNQPRPIEVFVEDDLSATIVSKIASQLSGLRLISIQRFGSAINCFSAVAGLLFSHQSIDDSIFILDGDVYTTKEEKLDRLNKIITGTDQLSERYKEAALASIYQYNLPQNLKPEQYLHSIIRRMDQPDHPDRQEIIDAANQIFVADESHKYIDDIIERLGIERGIGLNKIIDLVSLSPEWPNFTQEIQVWLRDKITPLLENPERVA